MTTTIASTPHIVRELFSLDRFREGLTKALERGGYEVTYSRMLEMVRDGKAFAVATDDAVVIALVQIVAETPVLFFWLVTGDLDDIGIIARTIQDQAKAAGIRRAQFLGTEGWDRMLPHVDDGWEALATLYVKEL